MSVLTLHCGTWHALDQQTYRAWQAAVLKIYASLQARDRDGQVRHVDMYKLARDAGQPMPMELLYLHRLKMLVQLLRVNDPYVRSTLIYNFRVAGHRSWLAGIRCCVQWLGQQLGFEQIPDALNALHDVDAWDSLQGQWRALKSPREGCAQSSP